MKSFAARPGSYPLAIFASVLGAYWPTLASQIPGGDSGELVVAAATLGVPHPPGYPLYTLLAHAFTALPFGSVTWRVSLFSAISGAAAAAFLAQAARTVTASAAPGLLAAGLFAFSRTAWTHHATPEVFALHSFFLACLLWIAARWLQSRDHERSRWALVAAFASGLALSHHHASVFLSGPLLAWMTFREIREGGFKATIASAGAFAAGLLPYLYLPWASARMPPHAWGDQTSWAGFLAHVTRAEYGTLSLGNPFESSIFLAQGGFAQRALHFLSTSARDTWALALGFALAALSPVATREPGARRARDALAFALAAYVVAFAFLANFNPDHPLASSIGARFWIQAEILLAPLAGIGLLALPVRARPVVAVLVPITLAIANHTHHRGRDLIERFAHALLEGLPERSILLVRGDHLVNALAVVQHVEGTRPDVDVLPQNLLTYGWFKKRAARHHPGVVLPGEALGAGANGYTLSRFFAVNLGRRIFVANGLGSWDTSAAATHQLWAVGYLEEVLPRSQPPNEREWRATDARLLSAFDVREALPYPLSEWESEIARQYWHARHNRANRILGLADSAEPTTRPTLLREAIAGYEELEKSFSAYREPILFKNLGAAFQRLGDVDPSSPSRMREAWARYLSFSESANDPDQRAIREILSR